MQMEFISVLQIEIDFERQTGLLRDVHFELDVLWIQIQIHFEFGEVTLDSPEEPNRIVFFHGRAPFPEPFPELFPLFPHLMRPRSVYLFTDQRTVEKHSPKPRIPIRGASPYVQSIDRRQQNLRLRLSYHALMIGSHLSISGGIVNALTQAQQLDLDTVQVFTKNQRQWRIAPLKDADREAWLAELEKLGWTDRTVCHATYLANLASPNPELWEKSAVMMRTELDRCEALSIRNLVFHPGAHTGKGEADAKAGIERIAKAVARILAETAGYKTVLCLENTAGAGTTLGRSFEELATIADLAEEILSAGSDAGEVHRIGYCIDTCHALAAGYDLTSYEGAERVFDEFARVCSKDRLRVLHLNDSKGAMGSHTDRHTHIGQGEVSLEAFKFIMNCADFSDVPKILETPKGESPKGIPWDTVNRAALLEMVSSPIAAKRGSDSTAGA